MVEKNRDKSLHPHSSDGGGDESGRTLLLSAQSERARTSRACAALSPSIPSRLTLSFCDHVYCRLLTFPISFEYEW